MSILKASGLSELLKEYDVDVSPKNIGRFSKNYGIKKDPNRPSASGFYLEPTGKQLEKISSQYEKNILKAPGSTEAGKEAFKKRETRAKELLTKGYNQTEANNILKKEFNMSMKNTLTNVANDLRKEGVKIISGRESDIKTPASKFSKERRKLQDAVSDASKERLMTKLKREAGFGNYDLAHRLSMQQNKILGTELISSNLGLDTKKINREIIKPIENELEKIYKKQISVANKIKKEGASSELRKELESLNKQVSEVVATTDGRLQGIHIDEYNLKPKTIGIDYAKSFGAGVIPDKPVSQLTKEEIQLAIKQIPGQLEAIKKEPSLASRMSNQLGFGPSGMIDVGEEVIKDVKGVYGKYAPQIAKGALTGLQVLGTPAISVGFYATDVGMDLKEAADEGNLTAKKALDAFVGQGEKGLYFFLPELAKDVVTNPIANKILQLGKIGRFATPTGAVLSTVGVAKDFYDQYKEFQALSPEEKEKRIKESTYTPTEQDFQMMQEAESRASAATGGRINFAEGSSESKEGGFVEFGDPETWDEKFSEFTKRAVHSRPIEKNQSTIFGKYANQIAETRLGPEDPLSKYKSYSEEELLGNIEAKRPNQLQSFSLEDYQLNTMPMFRPKDIVPKGSRPVMPNIYDRGLSDGILELATGGRVGFKDGPEDPTKRKFIKGAGIVGLVGLGAKYVPDLFQAAKKTKTAVKLLPKVAGMPEWFPSLIAKMEKEGVDVIGGVGVKDAVQVKKIEIPIAGEKNPETIFMTKYPDGRIEINTDMKGGAYDEPFELHYKPPKTIVDEKTGKVTEDLGDFSVIEQRPRPVGGPEDADYDFDFEILSKEEALSDLEKIEKITTGKIKDLKTAEKRAANRNTYYNSPYEDITNRFGDGEIEYDRMKDLGLLDD